MYKKKKKNVKKFRKKFNTHIIKKKSTYSVEDLTELFKVHKSTVSSWLRSGLKKIDDMQPYLVWGQDLIDFINQKNQSSKRPCKDNQLFCCKCKKARYSKDNTAHIKVGPKRTNLIGICATCDTSMYRTISPSKIATLAEIFIIEEVE